VVEEQEFGGPLMAGVRDGALRAAVGDPVVEDGEGVGLEGHHAFGAELADGYPEPGAVTGEVDQAVQLEVE